MTYGFFRVACASPDLTVADCNFNAKKIVETTLEADKKDVQFLVFPELSITGYSCGDLFLQRSLKSAALEALKYIAKNTEQTNVLIAVGLPLEVNSALYNCAAFIHRGKILAFIAKTFIPNYSEFYEKRWFTSVNSKIQKLINIDSEYTDIPFGTKILLEDKNNQDLKIACEICEDMWVPISPSSIHSINNAIVVANLSASNEVIGKAEYRRSIIKAMSGKSINAYIYANAGYCESTTDTVFSGHNMIAANGTILAESKLFEDCGKLIIADIDIQSLKNERLRTVTFTDTLYRTEGDPDSDYAHIDIDFTNNQSAIGFDAQKNAKEEIQKKDLYTFIDPHPFVPSDSQKRKERCKAVIELQAMGLVKRLKHINAKSAVIGLSGGLDSTLALLVTATAFDKCGLDRKGIIAVTMPCFGTTGRTYNNACALAKETGVSLKEIDIKKAVLQHFSDIGQDPECHDVTYENSQARERTQILMDIANKTGGIVIGTGDLSELALGWCTYNGDQMSMYGVNASIPKTLVRYLTGWYADEAEKNNENKLSKALRDILDTPVSPELLPPEGGNISQKTEDLVGPYELHDFFLYNMLRKNFTPKKIFFLSLCAFEGKKPEAGGQAYTRDFILKWLKTFYRRFFAQQFKRSCMPDGAKVGTVSLSPRGDWRMPSDASAAVWLEELESI